jgi:hypothetical protein
MILNLDDLINHDTWYLAKLIMKIIREKCNMGCYTPPNWITSQFFSFCDFITLFEPNKVRNGFHFLGYQCFLITFMFGLQIMNQTPPKSISIPKVYCVPWLSPLSDFPLPRSRIWGRTLERRAVAESVEERAVVHGGGGAATTTAELGFENCRWISHRRP